MSVLPLFKNNETKNFKFTQEQYILLETEYERYNVYLELLKRFDVIYKLKDSFDYTNHKRYEIKNIIDRFILECINHGISPEIYSPSNEQGLIAKIESMEQTNHLSNYLFFNPLLETIWNGNVNGNVNGNSNVIVNSDGAMCKTIYYNKMLQELKEKHFFINPENVMKINKAFYDCHKTFSAIRQRLLNNTTKLSADCSITYMVIHDPKSSPKNPTTLEDFVIKYKNYYKTINSTRYFNLIKNYDKPFPFDILRVLLRYAIFDTSSQQWSIGMNLYEEISDLFDISFEMFASPLNFNMNRFCSLFIDTDKIFGSFGTFYNMTCEKLLNQNIKGVFYNPPYCPILMTHTTKLCINLLAEMEHNKVNFNIISFLPNWADAEYIINFVKAKYTVSTRVIQKSNYFIHEKDKGKLIKGSFDLLIVHLNSMKNKKTPEELNTLHYNFNQIIRLTKEEVKTIKI